MRPKSLVVLFAVVAVLGAFIWFFERDLPSTDERAERSRRVLPVEPDEITSVAIERGGEVMRLGKSAPEPESTPASDGSEAASGSDDLESGFDFKPDEWRILEPLVARADADSVSGLLDTLTSLEKVRTLEEVDRAGLGLVSPRIEIVLEDGEKNWRLEVGEEIPASANVVVSLAGRPEAYVVAKAFLSQLEKEPGDWRSRKAFAESRDDITGVSWTGPEGEIRLARKNDGFWLDAPFADEADQDKVDDLIGAIADLEIQNFVDDPTPAQVTGLDPPVLEVLVGVETREAPIALKLGSLREDDSTLRFFALDGQVFDAKSGLAEMLGVAEEAAALDDRLDSASVAGWQSTSWTRAEVFEMNSIRISGDGEDLVLERQSGDWLRGGEKIPYTVASDVLYALTEAAAEQVVSPAALPQLAEPSLEVSVATEKDNETLFLYAETPDGYPARREGRDALLMLSVETVEGLRDKIEAARTAEPVPEPVGEEGS